MVVLDSNGTVVSAASQSAPHQYHHLQYVQPLPSDYDEKCDPLAMLTRACNKIETDLMKSHGEHKITSTSSKLSPRSSTDRPESSSSTSSHHNHKSASPINFKVRPPSSEKRPHSSSSSSTPPPPSKKPTTPASAAPSATPPATTSRRPEASPLGLPAVAPSPPVCVDPLCRDPTCPTTAARNAHFLNFFAGARPGPMPPYFYPPATTASALFGLPSPGIAAPPASTSSPTTTSTSSTAASIGGPSPFVCNWMSGAEFCGRRFSSSDDLMSHLRSHTTVAAAAAVAATTSASASPSPSAPSPTTTSSMPNPADTLAALQAAQLQALYPALGSQSALAALQARATSAAVAASSLSPGSARFHPYIRPGGLPLPAASPYPFGPFPGHVSPFAAGSPFLPYGLPGPFGPYP